MSVQLSINGNDVTGLVRVRSGVAFSRGKDQLRKYAPASAGQLDTALDNIDGSLNPTTIPFAPGDQVQATLTSTGGGDVGLEDETEILLEDDAVMLLESGAVKALWTGHLTKTRQLPDNQNRSVAVLALGDFSFLRGKRISTQVYQNISTGAALNIILDLAGWPTDRRIIATGLTVLPWWWLDRANAFDAAEQLRITEGPEAVWVEDRDGNAVFQDRAHRTTQTRSLTSQITFTDSDIVTIDYDENEDNTIEQCTMQVDEMAAQELAPVWTGQDITLAPFEVRRITFKTGEPFINGITPDPTPSNTIWKFVGSQTLTSGTYKIEYLGQRTVAIPHSASGSAIAAVLQALSTIGPGNASGSGSSLNTGVFIELKGAFAGINVADLPTIVESTLNPVPVPADINVSEIQSGGGGFQERQRLEATGPLVSGMWSSSITFVGSTHTTGLLNHNATATEIKNAFAAIFGLELTTAFNGPISAAPVDVNFVDIFSENIENVVINNFSLMMNMPECDSERVSIATRWRGRLHSPIRGNNQCHPKSDQWRFCRDGMDCRRRRSNGRSAACARSVCHYHQES